MHGKSEMPSSPKHQASVLILELICFLKATLSSAAQSPPSKMPDRSEKLWDPFTRSTFSGNLKLTEAQPHPARRVPGPLWNEGTYPIPCLKASINSFFLFWSSTQYTLGITNSDITRHSGQDLKNKQIRFVREIIVSRILCIFHSETPCSNAQRQTQSPLSKSSLCWWKGSTQ